MGYSLSNIGNGISAAMIQAQPHVRAPYVHPSYLRSAPRAQSAGQVSASQLGASPTASAMLVGSPHMTQVRDVDWQNAEAAGLSGIQNVSATNIQGSQIDASGRPELQWGQVDPALNGVSGLQAEMEQQATEDLRLRGQLSAEDERAAQQSARSAFADRGMRGANAGIFAEAMNRDVYARQRQAERRGFAQSTEQIGQTMRLADQSARNQMGLANAQGDLAAQQGNLEGWMGTEQFNAGNRQQAAMLNQQANLAADQGNQQMGFNVAGLMSNMNLQNAQGNLAAQQSNQQTEYGRNLAMMQSGLQASLANQGSSLRASLANQQMAGQYAMADQSAGLQASLANQQSRLQTNLANQNWQGRYAMANQNMNQWVHGTNQQAEMQAQLANQRNDMMTNQLNQSSGLQAAMANLQAQTSRYGVDQEISQDRWNFRANQQANQDLWNRDLGLLQSLYGQSQGGGGSSFGGGLSSSFGGYSSSNNHGFSMGGWS